MNITKFPSKIQHPCQQSAGVSSRTGDCQTATGQYGMLRYADRERVILLDGMATVVCVQHTKGGSEEDEKRKRRGGGGGDYNVTLRPKCSVLFPQQQIKAVVSYRSVLLGSQGICNSSQGIRRNISVMATLPFIV